MTVEVLVDVLVCVEVLTWVSVLVWVDVVVTGGVEEVVVVVVGTDGRGWFAVPA